jgi:hypothetical protein
MTWKNERICHRVLCPLLGYWRRANKRKRRRESTGERDEDRSEYVRVFETFFESICPYAKKCVIDSCRLKQILLLDCEGFRRLWKKVDSANIVSFGMIWSSEKTISEFSGISKRLLFHQREHHVNFKLSKSYLEKDCNNLTYYTPY